MLRLDGDDLYRVALAGYSRAGSECCKGLSVAAIDQRQHSESSTKDQLEKGPIISDFF